GIEGSRIRTGRGAARAGARPAPGLGRGPHPHGHPPRELRPGPRGLPLVQDGPRGRPRLRPGAGQHAGLLRAIRPRLPQQGDQPRFGMIADAVEGGAARSARPDCPPPDLYPIWKEDDLGPRYTRPGYGPVRPVLRPDRGLRSTVTAIRHW